MEVQETQHESLILSTTSEPFYPKEYKSAGLFVQINESEEVCVMTHHSSELMEAKPFTLEFKAVQFPKDFKGKFTHFELRLPTGHKLRMTYKVIE